MNFSALAVELTLLVWGLFLFFYDLFGGSKRGLGYLALIGVIAAFWVSFLVEPGAAFSSHRYFVNDAFALFLKRVFLLAGFLAVLASYDLGLEAFPRRVGEFYLLLFFSLLGMSALVSARELITLFVSFELLSIPLYVLAGYLKNSERSAEAALKFFLFGSFSSALLLLGLALLYALTGTTSFTGLAWALGRLQDSLYFLALLLLVAGFGFKIAAVPFHMWVPDTYEGAPTPFVAFLSVAPKAAGFGVIFRFFLEVLDKAGISWVPLVALLAAVTIVAGNLMAIPQTNIKRLLAYSGIAHIGYMLLGLAAHSTEGAAMVLFYLVTYVFANMGAFMYVEAVYRNEKSDDLSAYFGYAQRSPLYAFYMLLFLLSLGGIPFVAGFWAKLWVFLAAARSGFLWLVFLGAIFTVVALWYYFNVLRKIYIEEPRGSGPLRVPGSLAFALTLSALAVILIGLFPGVLYAPAHAAATSLLPPP